MKGGAVLAGAALGLLLVVALWGTAVVDPPEGISRSIATLSALYPGSTRGAEVERIPCPPLRHLRLYVVCTGGCADAWVVVGVRGLWPENLENPGRIPPQPIEEARRRVASAMSRERLSLDAGGAREMIGCYLRLEGYLPGLVLTPMDLVALERVRGDEDAMRRLAEGLDAPDAVSRIDPEATGDGWRALLYYWDTAEPGRPVLELDVALDPNGILTTLEERGSVRGGSGPGSTPDTPPS